MWEKKKNLEKPKKIERAIVRKSKEKNVCIYLKESSLIRNDSSDWNDLKTSSSWVSGSLRSTSSQILGDNSKSAKILERKKYTKVQW